MMIRFSKFRAFVYFWCFVLGIWSVAYLLSRRELLQNAVTGCITCLSNTNYYKPVPDNIVHCSSSLKVTFIIFSSSSDMTRREAIRRTWLQLYNSLPKVTILAKFVVGVNGLNAHTLARLNKELSQFEDLVFFTKLEDSFDNLALKLHSALHWAHDNHKFDYLIKCDSDSFIQVDRLIKAIHSLDCPPVLYWGYFSGQGHPDYKGKWSEKQWFLCPHFLPYAVGGGYVLSWEVVSLITRMKNKLSFFKNEDVTLGLWLAPFNLKRFHDIRFNTEGHSHGCNNNYIISHKEKVATFIQKRKNLLTKSQMCAVEHEVNPSYLYNWSVSPSFCCRKHYGITVPQ